MPKQQVNNEIDLSKIKNIDAVERSGEHISFLKKKKNKFDFREPEIMPLPSKGRLYKNITSDQDILNGHIKLYPMTIKDEEVLSTSKYLRTGSVTRMLFANCIASEIDAKDILIFDSNILLFKLRQMSYGDDYTFSIKCSSSICDKEYKHTLKISSLQFNDLPEEVIEEPIVIKLPKTNYTVSFVLPRLHHSEMIYIKNSNRRKTTEDSDMAKIDNLVLSTISITDPHGADIPNSDWEDFYSALPAIDRTIIKERTQFETGADELKGVICPYCGTEYGGSIPIGIEFFRL